MSAPQDGGYAFPVPNDANVNRQEGMTLRQYAAIKLKVPDSGVDWLDDMIERSRRDDLAAMAMQGAAASEVTYTGFKQAAHDSYEMADAMRNESK